MEEDGTRPPMQRNIFFFFLFRGLAAVHAGTLAEWVVVSGASACYQLGLVADFKGRRQRFQLQLLIQGSQVSQTGVLTHALTHTYIMKSRIVTFVIHRNESHF